MTDASSASTHASPHTRVAVRRAVLFSEPPPSAALCAVACCDGPLVQRTSAVMCAVLCAVMCGDVQSAAVPGETLCGICAIAFRKDGLALAAYSRISGFVYIWTMHPAWLTRMSNAGASRSPFSSLLSAAVPSTAAASVQLQPLRVMAAPAAAPPPPAELAAGPADLTFALTWAADGRTLELRHDSRLLGSMPVQCP